MIILANRPSAIQKWGSIMNYEAWIWTELLAFDNTAADQGVRAYLDLLGFTPVGISLLASASDFILLHESLDEERPLFPDVCTRFGHGGNEERAGQAWSNWQLRSLVANLRAHGILVFVSIFAAYHTNRYHHEWLSDHQEARIVYDFLGETDGLSMIARLDNGVYYEDLFVPQLLRVLQDYGFDGWHGPDGIGPGGSLGHSDCSDGIIAQFADYLGEDCPPELERVTGHDISRLQLRMAYIWNNLRRPWQEFTMMRWESFWTKIVHALKPLGFLTMINSGNTRAAFESMYIYGMDYRRMARLGVDYLVVETVATGLSLINGGYERHFDFTATLAEMKAFVPEMKLLILHGVKDVQESYDVLRHAPSRMEREFYTLTNQYFRGAEGQLERCTTGFMVCLGDGLTATEWQYLRRQWQLGYAFTPVRTGEFTWLWSEAAVDGLMDDYPRHGTWPGFHQIAHLVEHGGVQVQCIARTEQLDQLSGPLVVANADLIPAELRQALARYRGGPVVLLGRLLDGDIDKEAILVTCRISPEYVMACVVLHSHLAPSISEIPSPTAEPFTDNRPDWTFINLPNYMPIPAAFWEHAAQVILNSIARWEYDQGIVGCRVLNLPEGLRVLTLENTDGLQRTALISCANTYLIPQFHFTVPPASVTKVSAFPYTPLAVAGDTITSNHYITPLHIPPRGIIVMDVEFSDVTEEER